MSRSVRLEICQDKICYVEDISRQYMFDLRYVKIAYVQFEICQIKMRFV